MISLAIRVGCCKIMGWIEVGQQIIDLSFVRSL